MEIAVERQGSTIGATLLITGCCIGAGMIGLPVISAMAGFIPSTLAMILCYGFATSTGLLLLEATLWFDQRVNLISMANFALGRAGKAVAGTFFLFLFYCLFVAYIDGGGQLFANMLSVSRETGILLCVCCVAVMVYGGTFAVSLVSRLLFLGLVFSYFALLSLGLPHIQKEQLLYKNWDAAISTIPILLVCFGYQNLIPTLTYYVRKNVAAMRTAIFVGNLIPFVIYFLWNGVILGILSDAHSVAFAEAVIQSNMVTGLLEKASNSESVIFFAKAFSLFAIMTPFMANAVSFVDFFKDGLNRHETKYEMLLIGLVFVPPTLLTLFYPHLFLQALGIAGGFADVILLGVLPVLIVWIGRYVKKVKGPYKAPGGKLFLLVILLLSFSFLLIRS